MKVGAVKCVVGFGVWAALVLRAQPFLLDPGFPVGAGPDHWVRSVAVQADGRILIAGEFSRVAGEWRPGLARLLADGSLDRSFQPALTDPVRRVRLAPDGSLLLTGFYTNAARTWPGVARLRADGTFVETFVLPEVLPPSAGFSQIYPAAGGRFWVTGGFTNLGGLPMPRLARLHANGSVDATFRSPFEPGQTVSEVLPLPDGRLWVAGSFTNVGGVRGFRLTRLLADGSVDTSFQSPLGPENSVSQLHRLADGRVLARWSGPLLGELFPRRLVRLLSDGAPDPTYPPTFQWGEVLSAGLILTRAWPDGSAWVAGTFVALNGLPRPGVGRLLPEGAADPCYDPGLGVSGLVLDADFASDGSLVLAGTFSDVEGQPKPYLARLHPPGACEPGELEWGRTEVRVSEDSRRLGLSVIRRGGADRESRVRFEVLEGTARAREDFVPRAGTLTLAAGARSASLEIELLADPALEAEEYFSVRLSEPEGARLGAQSEVTVTLVDAPPGGQAGRVDALFRPALPWPVNAILFDPQGLWVAGGGWGATGSTGGVRRLLWEGHPDPAFAPVNCDAEVFALARLPDGRLVLGGAFHQVNGLPLPGLARLDSRGEPDPDYAPLAGLTQPGEVASAQVTALIARGDGSLLLAGRFRLPGTRSTRVLLGVSPDGRVDPGAVAGVERDGGGPLLALPEGGALAGVVSTYSGLLRLLPDGRVDPQFVSPVNRPAAGTALALEVGGSVLAGGPSLLNWPSAYEAALVRLNRDGSLAADLTAAGGWVAGSGDSGALRAVQALPEGKVLVGGRFLAAGGLPGRAVTRLFPDGRPDPSFDAGPARNWHARPQPASEEIPAEVRVLASWPEGGWLAGGDFQEMDGVAQPFLVRLLPATAGQQPAVQLILATNRVAEGLGQIQGQVRRRGDASAPVSVRLRAVAGEAQPGVDFEPLDLRLELGAGEWGRDFAVRLHEDTRVGPARAFRLELSEPSPGLTLLEPAGQAVTILDDDVNVEFAATTFAGSEDDGGGYVGLVRFGAPGPEVTVHLHAGQEMWTRVLPAAPEGGPQTNEVWLPWPDDTTAQGPLRLLLRLEVAAGGTPGEQTRAEWVVADNDFALAPARGVAGRVHALAPAPGGGLWVAGEFTAVHGVPRYHVARLTADLSVDPTFDPGAGPDGPVTAVLALESGGVVLAGTFEQVARQPRRRLARLRADGTVDPEFDAGAGPFWTGSGLSQQPGRILALAAAPEGGLWVGGQFTVFDHEPAVALVRLDRHGRVNRRVRAPLALGVVSKPWPPVRPGGWTHVRALLPQPDGGVLVGGLLNVPTTPMATATFGLLRLKDDGAVDPDFSARPLGAELALETLARDAAGRIWVGGRLSSTSFRPRDDWLYLARFRPDGYPDEVFRLQGLPVLRLLQSWVRQILPQPDGSALVLVEYLEVAEEGGLRAHSLLDRVQAEGQWDLDFPILRAAGSGFAGSRSPPQPGDLDYADYAGGALPLARPALLALQATADGRVVLGGSFTHLNDQPRRRLARLDPSGALTGQFRLQASPRGGAVRVTLPLDVPWPYRVETSVDLRHWTAQGTNATPWQGWSLDLPAEGLQQFLRAVQVP